MTNDLEHEPNVARKVAAMTFTATLKGLHGNAHVSERDFADAWTAALAAHKSVSVNGWYDPPPGGMALLAGLSRVSFRTLRDESNWPGSHVIDWGSGALYAYSSVVNVADGMPGDFAVTLYFGDDPAVRAHFLNAYQATREVLAIASVESSSQALFRRSTEIFSEAGLRNCVVSYTDTTPLDLGHTYPVPDEPGLDEDRRLKPTACDIIRKARRFLNDDSDWDLSANGQFTIEPQLVSSSDFNLPQVTFHYVIDPVSGRLLNEQEGLLNEFGLGLSDDVA